MSCYRNKQSQKHWYGILMVTKLTEKEANNISLLQTEIQATELCLRETSEGAREVKNPYRPS